MSSPVEPASFWVSLREAIRKREVFALLLIPAVLVVVFLFPTPLKRSLAFSYVDPSALTAYTAHFTHLTIGHLGANVLGYGVLASTGYTLAVLADRRKTFGVFLTAVMIIFPPVLSVLNMAVPRPAITYGFSGINMAIAGVFPLLLTEYAGRELNGNIETRFAPGLFFLVMALVAIVAIPTQPITIGIAIAGGLIALIYGYQLMQSINDRSSRNTKSSPSVFEGKGWLELWVLGAVVAVGYPIIGYPSDPASASQVVNIYVHTLGYALAFIGTYIGLESGIFE